MGDDDREYRYNSYVSRYHLRHIDLMDLLAMYQARGNAPLDAMARLCGFPGKLGMDGSQVYGAYLDGKTDEIRRYCETDAMNTYLLWCRFEKMRGRLDETGYAREIESVREVIGGLDEVHWREYLAAWPVEASPARRVEHAAEGGAERATVADIAADGSPSVPVEPITEPSTPELAAVVQTTIVETTEVYIDSSSIRT
jgi:hypothetical protein